MFTINRDKLRQSHETPWLILDIIMLALLLVNLGWLIFDALYATSALQRLLAEHVPSLYRRYQPVHANFLFIDLAFIAVFFTEFCVRWAVSVKHKEHLRWYFFPVLHWYDLIGLIPLPATRLFRFLRVFSILHRLHKKQIIDLNHTRFYRFFAFYYDVAMEELSDRIVIKVLSDVQKDIRQGSPLVNKISQQVLTPRQPVLSRWLAGVMQHMGQNLADESRGSVIRDHVRQSVNQAIKNNPQMANLQYLPVVGRTIESTLEQTVTDIVTSLLVHLLSDIDDSRINRFIETNIKGYAVADDKLDQEVLQVIDECVELVKAHVAQQRWKSQLSTGRGRSPLPDVTQHVVDPEKRG